MNRTRPRRTTWLRELELALLLGLILVSAGALIMIWLATRGPVRVPVPSLDALDPDATVHLTGGATLDPHGTLDVAVDDPTPAQSVLSLLASLPSLAVVALMLLVLVRLVRNARKTDPFTAGVVQRLRRLAVAVMIAGPLAWAVEIFARALLVDTVDRHGFGVTVGPLAPVAWLLIATGYLAAAEVTGRGQALRAELEGVV